MSRPVPHVPPGDYELLPIVGAHSGLVYFSSIALAILFAERGVYAHLASRQQPDRDAALLIAASALAVLAGMLASFLLPPRLMPEGDQTRWLPRTLNFLFAQAGIAIACVAAGCLAALALHISLVYPDLLAITWLLRDEFLYLALGAIVYHGFVLFVRYLGFLYQTGGADKTKVISFQAGALLLIGVVGFYQYTVDLIQVMSARPDQGIMALHLTVRDFWMALMVAVIFIWQIGRVGDH